MNKTYYDILEISPCAKKDEIKIAFRKLARKFHPDINHTRGAEILFKQVNLAAKTLLDDSLREQYDFAYGFSQQTKQNTQGAAQEARETYKKATDDYKKQTEFSKTLNEFFAKKEKAKEKKEPNLKKIDGEDILAKVTISQEEALIGTVRKVNILESEKCPKCFGSKFVNGSKCSFCEGEGEKTSYKKISVKIPPNIKDGIKIRVRTQGHEGKNGGKNGDLYLAVKVEKNIYKKHEGKAFLEVPITPSEAVLGADIKIPTPSGAKILKIPPKTRSNTIFKLLDCGFLEATSNKCDVLMVKVVIDICPQLSDKEIELFRLIKEAQNEDIRGELFKNYGQRANNS